MKNIEKVFSAESQVKNIGVLIKSMLFDLSKSWNLAFNLMKRDLSAQYRQSLFGFAWAFIPSIVTAATFTLASQNKILNVGATNIPYTAYVLFSVTLWQTFSESVLGPVQGVAAAKGFITKINFPKEALFMAKFGESLFNFLIKTVLIAGIFLFYKIVPAWGVLLAPLIVFTMILLGQSIGLLLAPINMIYQDISKGLPLVLGLGMFITPVVYPMPQGDSMLATIVKVNPLTYLISGIRDVAIFGHTDFTLQILWIGAITIVLFLFSWIFFRLSMPYVIERCS